MKHSHIKHFFEWTSYILSSVDLSFSGNNMKGIQLPLTDPTFVSSISMTNYTAFLRIT